MAQAQRDAIARAITQVMEAESDSTLCCTLEAINAGGQEVSIQVMQDSLNISPYAFDDDPVEHLQKCGALEGLGDVELETVDWDGGTFAIVGLEGLDPPRIAQLVDQTFVKLLSCDEKSYSVTASTEDIG